MNTIQKALALIALILGASSSLMTMNYEYTQDEVNQELWQAIKDNKNNKTEAFETMTTALKKGADINMPYPDVPDTNLLDYARRKGNFVLYLYLLNNKIDVNKQNEDGNTPLHLIFFSNLDTLRSTTRLPWIKILYQYGADINQKNKNGETPLHMAVRAQDADAVKYLLEQGANPDTQRKSDKITPLDSAKKYGNKEIIKLIENALKKHEELKNKKQKIEEKELENKEKKELKQLEQGIKKGIKKDAGKSWEYIIPYGKEKIIFKFEPSADQINPRYIVDTTTLEIIGTYTDKEDEQKHYTIEYYNPFVKNAFKPIEISKEAYDKKKQVIDKLWNDKKEQARFLIDKTNHPNITYKRATTSVYKKGDQYEEAYGGHEINNPKTNAFEIKSLKDSKEFDTIAKEYVQQQKLLKKLHKNYITYGEETKKFPLHYDINFKYSNQNAF